MFPLFRTAGLGGCGLVAEDSPSMCQALCSVLSTDNKHLIKTQAFGSGKHLKQPPQPLPPPSQVMTVHGKWLNPVEQNNMSMTHIKKESNPLAAWMEASTILLTTTPHPASVQTVSGKKEEHRIGARFMATEMRIRKTILPSRRDWELSKWRVVRQRVRSQARQTPLCQLRVFPTSLNFL